MITFIVNTHKGRGGGICPLCPPYICHRDFSSSWLLDYQASLTNSHQFPYTLIESILNLCPKPVASGQLLERKIVLYLNMHEFFQSKRLIVVIYVVNISVFDWRAWPIKRHSICMNECRVNVLFG